MSELPYQYQYPRPAVTVDCLIFAFANNEPEILLIKRKNDPFQGQWALPGGFVDEKEPLKEAAARELREETGKDGCTLVQVGAYGNPGRDPRGHTITVAYMAFVPSKDGVQAGDDAAEAEWHSVARLPPMAFDHVDIVADAWRRLQFESASKGVSVLDRCSAKELGVFPATIDVAALRAIQPGGPGAGQLA